MKIKELSEGQLKAVKPDAPSTDLMVNIGSRTQKWQLFINELREFIEVHHHSPNKHCTLYNAQNNKKVRINISRKENPEEELKRLRKENRSLKSNLGKANDKLKRAKGELTQTKGEFQKKDVAKTTLSKEQKELLSTLFPDIDIRFW